MTKQKETKAMPLSEVEIPLDMDLDYTYGDQCHRVSVHLQISEAPANGNCTICNKQIKPRTSKSQEWQGHKIVSAKVEEIENTQGMFPLNPGEIDFHMIETLVESKLAGPNKKVVLCEDCCPTRMQKLLED
jgi:hypothetical protein